MTIELIVVLQISGERRRDFNNRKIDKDLTKVINVNNEAFGLMK